VGSWVNEHDRVPRLVQLGEGPQHFGPDCESRFPVARRPSGLPARPPAQRAIRDTLALAARQLVGAVTDARRETKPLEQTQRARPPLTARHAAAYLSGSATFSSTVRRGHQIECLEDESDLGLRTCASRFRRDR